MIPFKTQIEELFVSRFKKPAIAVALTGSQAKGWATSKSDIDLVVLIDDGTDPDKNDTFSTEIIAGHRAEILYLEPTYVKKRLDQFRSERYQNISYDERKFVEKIRSGIPIIGVPAWQNILSYISAAQYEAAVLSKSVSMSSKIFDDAVGHYLDQDYINAVESVRSLIQHEAESLLCMAGDTGERRRWLMKRLQGNPDISEQVSSGFAEFNYNMINTTYGTFAEWLGAAMRFHQYLQFLINLKMAGEPVDYFEAQGSSRSLSGLQTPDWLFVVNSNQRWFAKTPERGVVITPTAALLMMFCHACRSEQELMSCISTYFDRFRSEEEPVDVRATVFDLTRAGLLIQR